MREIDSEFATHDLVVVEVSDGTGGGLGVRVLGESEAFGTPGFAVVDEAEGDDASRAAEDLADLLFG
jgi:hypothetical protein